MGVLRIRRIHFGARWFAGFCCLANGAYLGVGWIDHAGDAGNLLKRGTPAWLMVAYGVVTCSYGLWLWHRLGAGRRTASAP